MSPKTSILLHLERMNVGRYIASLVASGRAHRLYCHMTDLCWGCPFDEHVVASVVYVSREDEGQE